MSESERRKPISVYLTPRAAVALQKYNMGSGYASASRTVEEIILAFDTIYMNMQTFTQFSQALLRADLSKDKKAESFLVLMTTLLNINNALSRLQPETLDLQ